MIKQVLGTAAFVTILSAANPVITSLQAPVGCITPPGYSHPSVCTPPSALPTDSFQLPAPGGTYKDPTFGADVRVLSGQQTVHSYATPSPISAKSRYVAVGQNGEQVNILDAGTGAVVYKSRPGNVTADPIRWDAHDDDTYYWLIGAQIRRHRLSLNQTDIIADFATDSTNRFTWITAGGTGDTSKDNWMGFWAPNEKKVCTIELPTRRTYCADYVAPAVTAKVGVDAVDFVLVSRGIDSGSGKRYVLLMAAPAIAVFSVDTAGGVLRFEYRGGELLQDLQRTFAGNLDGVCDPKENCLRGMHSDTFEDFDGQQYLAATMDVSSPCARMMATFRLSAGGRITQPTESGGGRTTGFTIHKCGGGKYESWSGNHVGCAKHVPYCALSTHGPIVAKLSSSSSYPFTTHLGELIVMRGNVEEMKRIALHRSIGWYPPGNDWLYYWSLPRAAMSPDGEMVVFDSNFGRVSGGTYLAATYVNGSAPVTVPSPALPANPVNVPSPAPALNPVPTISPIAGMRLQYAPVMGGGTVGLKIEFRQRVRASGASVHVRSSSPLVRSPASVPAAGGSWGVGLELHTSPVTIPTIVTITATLNGTEATVTVPLVPVQVRSVNVPTSVVAGGRGRAAIGLWARSALGAAVQLSSSCSELTLPNTAVVTWYLNVPFTVIRAVGTEKRCTITASGPYNTVTSAAIAITP